MASGWLSGKVLARRGSAKSLSRSCGRDPSDCGELSWRRFLDSCSSLPCLTASGSLSNMDCRSKYMCSCIVASNKSLTLSAELHLSAAILLLAKYARTSLPSAASRSSSRLVGLLGFSRTKYSMETIAKNVVYMENQYAPANKPRRLISEVMWMILRETLTQAEAHANARWSVVLSL